MGALGDLRDTATQQEVVLRFQDFASEGVFAAFKP